jgi:Na+-driven multidrug efflux pump
MHFLKWLIVLGLVMSSTTLVSLCIGQRKSQQTNPTLWFVILCLLAHLTLTVCAIVLRSLGVP